MSFLSGFDLLLLDPPSSALILRDSAVCFSSSSAACALDLLLPFPPPSPLSLLSSPDPFLLSAAAAFRRLHDRSESELQIHSLTDRIAALESSHALADRVAALELGFAKASKPKSKPKPSSPAPAPAAVERTYKWTTEIKSPTKDSLDRKYKLTATAKPGDKQTLKWSAELTGKGKRAADSRTYTFETSSTPSPVEKPEKVTENKNTKNKSPTPRIVEIEDPGTVVIKKVFRRAATDRSKGKRKEVSPEDAAVMIQLAFRDYMVRRSQVLRALRELAVAKGKLKEIRGLFSNFSYRGRIARDEEEKQRFTERIIVLLLTVDSIEGPDYMVRAAKKSMVEELEVMLQVIDPQPNGKQASFRRRKFDLPEGGPISKEMSVGVAEVVQMIDQEED